MGKQRNTYRGYSTTTMKNRADIPSASNISEPSTGYIDCTNIIVSAVNTAIGTSNVNALSSLCTHNNINKYSAFSPYIKSNSHEGYYDSSLNFTKPTTNYKLGDFAGYNHGAPTPGWSSLSNPKIIYVNTGNQASTNIDVVIGEIDYPGSTYIAAVLFDSANNVRGWGSTSLSGTGETTQIAVCTDPDYYTSGVTTSQSNMYVVGYAVTGISGWFQASDIENTVVCAVPNCGRSIINLSVRQPNEWHYDETGTTTAPSPWTMVGAPGMNWTTGYFDIGSLEAASSFNVVATAILYDSDYNYIADSVIYSGAYTAFDYLSGSAYLQSGLGTHGYRVVITFAYS